MTSWSTAGVERRSDDRTVVYGWYHDGMDTKDLRRILKTLSRPTLEDICEGTGLTAVERHIVMLSFLERLPVDVAADQLNMSVSTYLRAKRLALTRIRDFLDHMKKAI